MWFDAAGTFSVPLAGESPDDRVARVREHLREALVHRFRCRAEPDGTRLRLRVSFRRLLFRRPLPVDTYLLLQGCRVDVRRERGACVVTYRLGAARWWTWQLVSAGAVLLLAWRLSGSAVLATVLGAAVLAAASASLADLVRRLRAMVTGSLALCRPLH